MKKNKKKEKTNGISTVMKNKAGSKKGKHIISTIMENKTAKMKKANYFDRKCTNHM